MGGPKAAVHSKDPPQYEWGLTKTAPLELPAQIASGLVDQRLPISTNVTVYTTLGKGTVDFVSIRSIATWRCCSLPGLRGLSPFHRNECFHSEETAT